MNVGLIFNKFYDGELNPFTEKVYGYSKKKISDSFYILFEKSEANVLFDDIIYGCSTLLYNEEEAYVVKIDLSKAFPTKKELKEYMDSIDFEMASNADIIGELKKLTFNENGLILKMD